ALYFDHANAQATNQFQDAISFVIVPNVADFKKLNTRGQKPEDTIDIDPELTATVLAARKNSAGQADEGYDQVTFLDEMLNLLEWGLKYGFQVLFSPEERVRAGRADKAFFQELGRAYSDDRIMEHKDGAGDCAVLCVPDFIVMPPDGKLITGSTAEGAL